MTGDFLRLRREVIAPTFTLGKLFLDGAFFGYTCEDCDRHLESEGGKVYGQSAIPRGRYKVIISHSNRFGRDMPEIIGVPGFSGVRIHGGNTAADTLGCPLLGAELTDTGVRNCGPINAHLIALLRAELKSGPVFIRIE